jgi:hypothetical protein
MAFLCVAGPRHCSRRASVKCQPSVRPPEIGAPHPQPSPPLGAALVSSHLTPQPTHQSTPPLTNVRYTAAGRAARGGGAGARQYHYMQVRSLAMAHIAPFDSAAQQRQPRSGLIVTHICSRVWLAFRCRCAAPAIYAPARFLSSTYPLCFLVGPILTKAMKPMPFTRTLPLLLLPPCTLQQHTHMCNSLPQLLVFVDWLHTHTPHCVHSLPPQVSKTIESQLPDYFTASDIRAMSRLHGVGTETAAKLREIYATGALRRAGVMRDDPTQQARRELTGLWGVGSARAEELIGKGVTSVQQVQPKEGHPRSPRPFLFCNRPLTIGKHTSCCPIRLSCPATCYCFFPFPYPRSSLPPPPPQSPCRAACENAQVHLPQKHTGHSSQVSWLHRMKCPGVCSASERQPL